ncbi:MULTISPECIES: glycosyltransferase [Providencia]|uniref:glycosyltransferase n=1 Tax=Providencia TaxID=586 RepID=UPI0015EBCFF9|nr:MULTISPECIES: glycosyltransferase [Providencia]ELR5135753.1 lipopolysaccharide 1,3-galactosyltransferase [Providencia rettgeri]ELR5139280.1 lipopolysaccharide 1,3-galactosyltransferase [Providencia rettgeri]QLQ93704.1 lipopolysaccharide 1,3-galactosyltransferase [Providencia rettgeri]WEB84322.1 lipopolysaccharide 1,3-galactosyltransferase [Providencia rettgeri]HCH7934541.1 lipopolysaccharide 1,3-galactosyltransferase [Providencia rettgeri]
MNIEFDRMIKNKISIGYIDEDEYNAIHVAYGIDNNFLYGCGVSIVSLLINNLDKKFIFHVFIDNLMKDADIKKFREICSQYNTRVILYFIDATSLSNLPTTKNWTHAIYFRFIIAEYFKNKINYLLYLDADIICHRKIDDLIHEMLDGKVAAVVAERDASWWKNRANNLGFPEISAGYFNSGVMYINLVVWHEQHVTKNAVDLLMNHSISAKLSYPDQDVLNILLMGKVVYIKSIFNTQFSLNYELKDKFEYPVNEQTVFIHYVGPTKPWHEWACYPSAEPFLKARMASPWRDIPLMEPSSSNYLRYCAKHKIKQKKYLQGLIFYIQYFVSKIKR